MRQKFGLVTGLSDHTVDNIIAMISVALRVSIIEKHSTLDCNSAGADDSFSLESKELKELCVRAKTACGCHLEKLIMVENQVNKLM